LKPPQGKKNILDKLKKTPRGIQVLYISMEYCEGKNLKHFLQDGL
jgi:hypothetical protein